MNISSINSNAISQTQTTLQTNNKTAEEKTDSTAKRVALADTVEISDEAYSLASKSTAKTSSTETENANSDSSDNTSPEESKSTVSPPPSSLGKSADGTISEDELEKKIEILKKEIASLGSKADSDEFAKQQLAVKQSELAGKLVELLQLQQS